MKKLFILVISVFPFFNTYAQQQTHSKSGAIEGITVLKFKVAGLRSQQDADAIDAFLKKSNMVIHSSTTFQNGLCLVEVLDKTNYKNILFLINSSSAQIGRTIEAKYIKPGTLHHSSDFLYKKN